MLVIMVLNFGHYFSDMNIKIHFTLVFMLLITQVMSQSDTLFFESISGDIIEIINDYAEYKIGGMIGGGYTIQKNNKFIIKNDIGYCGGSKSNYRFISSTPKNHGMLQFIVELSDDKIVNPDEVLIFFRPNNHSIRWAKNHNLGYELIIDKMPFDSMIYVESYGYYPLKIKLCDITSGKYYVTLSKSQDDILYVKEINSKIICRKTENDTVIRCTIKSDFNKLKSLKPKLFYLSNYNY